MKNDLLGGRGSPSGEGGGAGRRSGERKSGKGEGARREEAGARDGEAPPGQREVSRRACRDRVGEA